MNDLYQWSGCFFGVLGTFLLALNNKWSRWGFVAYMFSNNLWLLYGLNTNATGIVVMQGFYNIITVLGLYQHFWSKKNVQSES